MQLLQCYTHIFGKIGKNETTKTPRHQGKKAFIIKNLYLFCQRAKTNLDYAIVDLVVKIFLEIVLMLCINLTRVIH